MNKIFYLLPLLMLLSGCFNDNNAQLNNLYDDGDKQADSLLEGAEYIEFLYKQQRGGVMVSSAGRIAKLLENQQSPYIAQVILIRLSSGRKLLIKHNIEKANAVPKLVVGETLTFSGTYRWNSNGGMILSTYQQADKPQYSGWLKYQNTLYQ
ncbi:DUF3465 domain-containing protein [Psychromonas hadalis]|uniref:DUF3465 domain-containing protein n=1 Tax=Psychromonas hadalis TaxID=211669 RepID=UPI0003B39AF0|nr:DUF3465 domain-containing protein [Psychromonas hadalis]